MADTNFTSKQREIVARKMGYEGPMSMFDTYLKSNPADEQKYALIGQKLMARGGMVKKTRKMATGGFTSTSTDAAGVTTTTTAPTEPTTTSTPVESGGMSSTTVATPDRRQQIYDEYVRLFNRAPEPEGLQYWLNSGLTGTALTQALQDNANEVDRATMSRNMVQENLVANTPRPEAPTAPQIDVATTTVTPDQLVNTTLAPTTAEQATAAAPVVAQQVTAPAPRAAETYTATTTAADVKNATQNMEAVQGTVSDRALVSAVTQDPRTSVIEGTQAEQGVATQVTGAPTRTVQEGEMVTGGTVDQARVDALAESTVAEQGRVTEEMTTQGQLNKMMKDFDYGNPPPWASAAIRSATAQMAARGIGASSIAGQALIQAAMEAATPIATADSAIYSQMEFQNLSNRQQRAMVVAEQRAKFLGMEFDQAFQTKVLNAAKISDIANQNFNAETQIALENARLTQTMDIANLNNRQAVTLAIMAQRANLETTNLSNRQAAAVQNAQAFLQMDLTNLNNQQQVELFKGKAMVDSILTDAAATNAAKQFNATSINQTNQFYDSLTSQVQQFNASQNNAMTQFNVDQANAIEKFNTELQNRREEFNVQQRVIIDQSNAVWRREIATAETAAINRANEVEATLATNLTVAEYNNEWQAYRDTMEYAWKSSESALDRDAKLVTAEIDANARIMAATIAKDADIAKTIGTSVASILGNTNAINALGAGYNWLKGIVTTTFDTNNTGSPGFNTGADVSSPDYYGGTSEGE